MAKYAVLKVGSRQYKVSEGDEILLEGFGRKENELSGVLLISDEGKTKLGNPLVKGAKVMVEVLGEEKGEKINVRKYKAKSRYRKAIGHRPQFTRVKVAKISV